jgi:hypothetical protein
MLSIRQVLDIFNEYLDNNSSDTELLRADGNMMRVANKFIIRPVMVVNKDLRDFSKLSKVIEYNTNLFASFYSMVFEALVSLHNLEPKVAFNLLSSDAGDLLSGMEEMAFTTQSTGLIAGLEAGKPTKPNKLETVFTRHVEVTVDVGPTRRPLVFPVIIHTTVKFVSSDAIRNLYSSNDGQNPLDRLDDLFAGSIEFWKDFVFAMDLIRDYKSRRLLDKDEVLKALRNRQYVARLKQVKTDYAGFSKLYQMLVITDEDVKKLKKVYRKTLNHDRTREKFLNDTLSFSATLVDELREYVTVYINGLENSIGLRFKDLSDSSKAEDQMEELLKILTSTRTI